MRVLLVEDDPDIRSLVELMLTNAGHEVTSATDGTSGLAHVRELHPELVFLDVRMPGINGFDVCRQIREDHEFDDVQVIMLTAHGDTEVENAAAAGANGLLAKPFSMQEIIDTAAAADRNRESRAS